MLGVSSGTIGVLLEKTGPGVWIGVTPDGDIERIDLNVRRYVTLDRRSDFPGPQAPFVYAFAPVPRAELESYHRPAQVMANLFNDAGAAAVDAYEWVVADVSGGDFRAPVSDDMIDEGVLLQDSAIVEIDGEEVFARRIAVADKASWIAEKESSKGDLRILGSRLQGWPGKTCFLDFKSGVTKMRDSKLEDWPLSGPRAALEFLMSVREAATDMTAYHLSCSNASGASQFSAAAHEHKVVCDMIRVGIPADQLDLSNLVLSELAVRRIIQIEMAVSRNPSAPDYSGLDLVMEQPVGAYGQAVTMEFNNWVAGKLKERSNIQKQARLYKEESGLGDRLVVMAMVAVDVEMAEVAGAVVPKQKPKPAPQVVPARLLENESLPDVSSQSGAWCCLHVQF